MTRNASGEYSISIHPLISLQVLPKSYPEALEGVLAFAVRRIVGPPLAFAVLESIGVSGH